MAVRCLYEKQTNCLPLSFNVDSGASSQFPNPIHDAGSTWPE